MKITVQGTDEQTLSSDESNTNDTNSLNITPSPNSNRTPWLNTFDGPNLSRSPIMVIMDDDCHQSPSVHACTPLIMPPNHERNSYSNKSKSKSRSRSHKSRKSNSKSKSRSKKSHHKHRSHSNSEQTKKNNSINDENDSDIISESENSDDDIIYNSEPTLLKSLPFPLKLDLKSPRLPPKQTQIRHYHSTPHPNNGHKKMYDFKPIPRTPIPKYVNPLKPPQIDTSNIEMEAYNLSHADKSDSDSSFNDFVFTENDYEFEIRNAKPNNVHKNEHRHTTNNNMPHINMLSPMTSIPTLNSNDTPIPYTSYQKKSMKSIHTFQTQSSLLDHEDEYDPPRASIQLSINTQNTKPSANSRHTPLINIKESTISPIGQRQIVCSIVEEENCVDESGCEVPSNMSFAAINDIIYHSDMDKKSRNNPLEMERNRSRSITIEIEDDYNTNTWNDSGSISTFPETETTKSNGNIYYGSRANKKVQKNVMREWVVSKAYKQIHKKDRNRNEMDLSKKYSQISVDSDIEIKPSPNQLSVPRHTMHTHQRRSVKIIRRENSNSDAPLRKKQTKTKKMNLQMFEPKMKMVSEMSTLSNSSQHLFTDSADEDFQEYLGTEYGVSTDGDTLSTYTKSNMSNVSSSYFYNSPRHDSYCSYSQSKSKSKSHSRSHSRPSSADWDEYIYNQQWQKALQAAYLRGFNKGYSMGVQFQINK